MSLVVAEKVDQEVLAAYSARVWVVKGEEGSVAQRLAWLTPPSGSPPDAMVAVVRGGCGKEGAVDGRGLSDFHFHFLDFNLGRHWVSVVLGHGWVWGIGGSGWGVCGGGGKGDVVLSVSSCSGRSVDIPPLPPCSC